jgi:hypothetical protein
VTEAEWLAATDPIAVLAFLHGRASARKLRLFACACCRHIWHLLPDERSRRAIEVMERHLDGRADAEEMRDAARAAAAAGVAAFATYDESAASAAQIAGDPEGNAPAWMRPADAAMTAAENAACDAADAAAQAGSDPDVAGRRVRWRAERLAQCQLLRDLFGPLPFRPAPANSFVPAWNDRLVVKIAQGIYAESTFERLPVLGDALEEAGCSDRELLGHLRGPGPHVRGCWAVDLILGKE